MKDMPAYKSDFPLMGEDVVHQVVNVSGNRSPYTKEVPKQTMGRGKSPTGVMASRGRSVINEAHGPRCYIQETLYHANAAESSATERNVKIMPKSMSRPDTGGALSGFWAKREFGQTS
jgi:hypothetical protein